jgi:hypothetical protein
MSADTIARLKITLDDVRPAVLRRIEVPFDIRLDRLHLAIQAAMGWTNTHLYEIRARRRMEHARCRRRLGQRLSRRPQGQAWRRARRPRDKDAEVSL